MTSIEKHSLAMEYSFLAKRSRVEGQEDDALIYYTKAAQIESELADYYLNKPELEPTRSIIVRSAAFLNLKAGLIEESQKYIFWGLANNDDTLIKIQLLEALEFSLALSNKSLNQKDASFNFEYITNLRERSVHYSIEPKSKKYGSAVTLNMATNFSNLFYKSFINFSKKVLKEFYRKEYKITEDHEVDTSEVSFFTPIISNSAFGSFKISLATDFLERPGENVKILHIKQSVLEKFHSEIFTKDLTLENIKSIQNDFTETEIEEIFSPLIKLKSNSADFNIAYIDKETLNKHYIKKIESTQKLNLIPTKKPSDDDLIYLESILRERKGKKKGAIIMHQELKSTVYSLTLSSITSIDKQSIQLATPINVEMNFDSEHGFILNFDDLGIEVNGQDYAQTLSKFGSNIIEKVRNIVQRDLASLTDQETSYLKIINEVFANPKMV